MNTIKMIFILTLFRPQYFVIVFILIVLIHIRNTKNSNMIIANLSSMHTYGLERAEDNSKIVPLQSSGKFHPLIVEKLLLN